MRHYCQQLRDLQSYLGDPPIFIAGDVFTHWNSPPELISFLLASLPPKCYVIAGNHDLAYHRHHDLSRSALWTLVEARKVKYLDPDVVHNLCDGKLAVRTFPCGYDLKNWWVTKKQDEEGRIKLAVIHAYCWKKEGHKEASNQNNISGYKDRLQGYDIAHFGDNHRAFLGWSGTCRVINPGTFMIRRADEVEYQPRVYILLKDKSVVSHKLDTSIDDFVEPRTDVKKAKRKEIEELFREVLSFTDSAADFFTTLTHYMREHGIDSRVQEIVTRASERGSNA
jgi:predicted phosphodiesterase